MSIDNLFNQLSPLTAQAQSLGEQALDKVFSVDDYVIDAVSNSLGSSMSFWLTQHPFFAWLFAHPIMAIVLALVTFILGIRLLMTIYRAIASLIDRLWLVILRSPWLLLKFLFGWEAKPRIPPNTTVTNYEITSNSQQLEAIMIRLDQIQQQQQEIIQDLALLKQQPITIERQQRRLLEKKISKNQ